MFLEIGRAPDPVDHGEKPHEWINKEDYNKPIDWRVLYKPCHKLKTKAVDMPKIVKARRVARKHGIDRESNPMPEKKGNRKLQSHGFDKSLRKKMDGTVERVK